MKKKKEKKNVFGGISKIFFFRNFFSSQSKSIRTRNIESTAKLAEQRESELGMRGAFGRLDALPRPLSSTLCCWGLGDYYLNMSMTTGRICWRAFLLLLLLFFSLEW